MGDRETDLILHKIEARDYAQIGNNNTGCPVGDIDNKLGSHGSVSTERKANENQTKPTEGNNIWAAIKGWRMNDSIQIYEQGDGNSKGYLAEFPTDSAVNKGRRVKHPDDRQRKTFRLNQGFFYQTNNTIPCNWEMCLSKKY